MQALQRFVFVFFIFTVFLFLSACSKEPPESPLRLQGQIFGTFWLVTLPDTRLETQEESLQEGIQRKLEAVDASMSTYREDSELSRLNQAPVGDWVAVSDPLFEVLQAAQKVAKASDGAFDVTLGGLVNLWNFGPEARPETLPEESELQARLEQAGYKGLHLDVEKQQVRRLKKSYIDLSALAKGYAVDQVAAWLNAQGIEDYLINIGGEVLVRGERRPDQPWRIGIELPDGSWQQAYHILPLVNTSVATSGNYRNYYEVEGQRFSHTINPRTGRPLTHHLASVTVQHPSNLLADAWATAFMVLGVEKSLEVANRENIKVLLISREDQQWKTWLSQPMKKHLGPELSKQLLN